MSVADLPASLAAGCRARSPGSRSEPAAGAGGSERTLALVKPEAYEDREAIESAIVRNGFTVLAKRQVRLTPAQAVDLNQTNYGQEYFPQLKRQVRLTPEQAADLYRTHYGREYFPQLVAHMTAGPVVALALAAADAVRRWCELMGPARVAEAQAYWPDSLRACYGRRTDYGDYYNGLHGSASAAEARREIHFFFPTMIVGPVLRHWQVRDYVRRHIAPTLQPALAALTQLRSAEPLLWLAEQLRVNNPNEPVWRAPDATEHERRCYSPTRSDTSLPSN